MIWSIRILIVADCNFNCWCSTVEFYHISWLNMGFPKVCGFSFRRSTVDFYHAWWINMDFPKVFENVNSEYPASMRSLGHRLRRRPWSSWSTRSQRHSACGVWACGWSCTHRIHVWYDIWGVLMVNVTIYSIHGSHGLNGQFSTTRGYGKRWEKGDSTDGFIICAIDRSIYRLYLYTDAWQKDAKSKVMDELWYYTHRIQVSS